MENFWTTINQVDDDFFDFGEPEQILEDIDTNIWDGW